MMKLLMWIFSLIGIVMCAFLSGLVFYDTRGKWLESQRQFFRKEGHVEIGKAISSFSIYWKEGDIKILLEEMGKEIQSSGSWFNGNTLRENIVRRMEDNVNKT